MFKYNDKIFISTDERDDLSSDANEFIDQLLKLGTNVVVYNPHTGDVTTSYNLMNWSINDEEMEPF